MQYLLFTGKKRATEQNNTLAFEEHGSVNEGEKQKPVRAARSGGNSLHKLKHLSEFAASSLRRTNAA